MPLDPRRLKEIFAAVLELPDVPTRQLLLDQEDHADSVNSLAQLHVNKGDYSAAEPLLRRAINALEKNLGPKHPDTIGSINNLALVCDELANHTEAHLRLRVATLHLVEVLSGPGRTLSASASGGRFSACS